MTLRDTSADLLEIVAVPVEKWQSGVAARYTFIGEDGHSVTDAFHNYAPTLLDSEPIPAVWSAMAMLTPQ